MDLDRALQREMLEQMAKVYPESFDLHQYQQGGKISHDDLVANLVYLKEHELIDMRVLAGSGGPASLGPPRITAKGLDFLADDGGLTAILGVVTVKIHDDTLRQLLANRIDQMPGNEAEKAPLRQALKELPAAAGKALLDKLVTTGVEHLPGTVESLRQWLLTIGT